MVKEKCMCIPFHFLEAPEILKVSQCADLGGGIRWRVVFVVAKMNQLDLGGRGGIICSLILQVERNV